MSGYQPVQPTRGRRRVFLKALNMQSVSMGPTQSPPSTNVSAIFQLTADHDPKHPEKPQIITMTLDYNSVIVPDIGHSEMTKFLLEMIAERIEQDGK